MAEADSTEYLAVGAENGAGATTTRPLDRVLGARFIRRVSRALEGQNDACPALNYAWSLPRAQTLSLDRHPYAELELAIETPAGCVAGSLHMSFGGYSEPSLILTGHTDALLLTSLFDKTWIPGHPGQLKSRGGTCGAELLGERRDVRIRRAGAKGNKAFIPLSKVESEEITVAIWGELPEQREARQRVQQEVANLPANATQFRDKVCKHVMWNVQIMQHVLKQADGGYSFRHSELQDCWTALDELADTVRALHPGDVVFDPALRDMEIAEIIDKRMAELTTQGGHP
ncbi:hypothetical protein [Ralstonia pickettii]|uniref:hypothetical protein n=1 Tax=Ralstonia pickettii TaxID=329 RepID=UPI0015BC3C47|nr:hypothetical protein [Ralstonia pickettii]NWK42886.1 hypothetical protein [Ralstonia pickettii]